MNIWRMMTLWDKILIAVLITAGIIGSALMSVDIKGTGSRNVVVKADGKIVKEIKINGMSDNRTYSFEFANNTGYLEVKDGAVRMMEMPQNICPEGVCSLTGWIKSKYQTIVCLPNKIIVSIENSQEDEVDIVL